MADLKNTVYAGIKGSVLALDRSTGAELWRKPLTGSGFVNLTLDGEQLIATTKGEIFCLDPSTGQTRWQSNLPGMGLGLITVVTSRAPNTASIVSGEKIRADEEAASAASTAAVIAAT